MDTFTNALVQALDTAVPFDTGTWPYYTVLVTALLAYLFTGSFVARTFCSGSRGFTTNALGLFAALIPPLGWLGLCGAYLLPKVANVALHGPLLWGGAVLLVLLAGGFLAMPFLAISYGRSLFSMTLAVLALALGGFLGGQTCSALMPETYEQEGQENLNDQIKRRDAERENLMKGK